MDTLHIHFFFLRHWCQLTRCAAPTEMHCPMPWLLKRSYAIGSQSFRMLYISYKKKIVAPLPHGVSLISRQAYKKMVSRYYAACFERPLNLFKHNTISGLGQCRDGSNINTSSQCQCLSQDLHFFQKRSYLIFLGSYLQKRAVIHQRRNCSMMCVNRLEAYHMHRIYKTKTNYYSSIINCVII